MVRVIERNGTYEVHCDSERDAGAFEIMMEIVMDGNMPYASTAEEFLEAIVASGGTLNGMFKN